MGVTKEQYLDCVTLPEVVECSVSRCRLVNGLTLDNACNKRLWRYVILLRTSEAECHEFAFLDINDVDECPCIEYYLKILNASFFSGFWTDQAAGKTDR